jgi:hypothetical protein
MIMGASRPIRPEFLNFPGKSLTSLTFFEVEILGQIWGTKEGLVA